MIKNKKGFTLIELLVVVLIIGILAAVALPQYKKAVVKTQLANMKIIVDAVYDAEQAYVLARGNYTKLFSELNTDIADGPVTLEDSYGMIYSDDSLRDMGWGSCKLSTSTNVNNTAKILFFISSPPKILRIF